MHEQHERFEELAFYFKDKTPDLLIRVLRVDIRILVAVPDDHFSDLSNRHCRIVPDIGGNRGPDV